MHQHPRLPASKPSPASTDRSNLSRTNSPRDREPSRLRSMSNQGSGSSEDFVSAQQEVAMDNTAAHTRLNQVIQNFHTKAALIILHSRVELAEALSLKSNEKRVNRWFNIELDETEEYNDEIRRWRKCDVKADRPPPLIIEIFLTSGIPTPGQRLVILDEDEKRWDVKSALESKDKRRRKGADSTQCQEVLLERWTIELGQASSAMPSDLTSILPLVYKKSIVLFRSLFTYCNFLPAWKLSHKVRRGRTSLKLGYRILDGSRMENASRPDDLDTPLYDSSSEVTSTYHFGETESPAGSFSVKVKYRENCDFRIDDSEELLSSRFLGTDDQVFQPTVRPDQDVDSNRTSPKIGSLPNDRRQHLLQRPELGHAYGSMSTFHQAGFGTGTSPLSALRSARDLGQPSPSPEQNRQAISPQPQTERPSLRGTPQGARRPSFSFQPFKAPALSASPHGPSSLGSSPRTTSTRVPVLGSLTEESHLPPPNAQAVAARRTLSHTSDNAPSSIASSPKPTPNRYTSSFSHRRARLSSGGTTSRPDEDQISSGRGSATSSNVPPGSGVIAEASAGASSGSMQEDDENISDFLKMLEVQKDLLSSGDASRSEAAARRTVNALDRFQKMRDSNAALSDSMTSSLMLARPSSASGRQPSSVPAMIGPTSISTSSSPGKPQSPHTPHTPFAPSRLSAAYSHDDHDDGVRIAGDQAQSSDNATTSGETVQSLAGTNIPAIDIPSSPRPFSAAYRRSSSAQRQPASLDDDIGDIFGMRSASMGAQEAKPATKIGATRGTTDTAPTDSSHDRSTRPPAASRPESNAGSASDVGAGRGSHVPYRSRFGRTTNTTPPQGSSSSFGGTNAGSIERTGESSASAGEGWARSGRYTSGQRPESKFADDDDYFPFAMEKSDFNTSQPSKEGNKGGR